MKNQELVVSVYRVKCFLKVDEDCLVISHFLDIMQNNNA